MNQRDAIKMSDAEIDSFLAGRHTMTMCTVNHDSTIHAVAMWYGFLDGAVAVETKAKSQKVQNLRRNPTLTVLIDDGETYGELRGVELVGRGEVIDDPDRLWELGVSVFERYTGPYTDDMKPALEATLNKRVAIKLHAERIVSWDHRKLAR